MKIICKRQIPKSEHSYAKWLHVNTLVHYIYYVLFIHLFQCRRLFLSILGLYRSMSVKWLRLTTSNFCFIQSNLFYFNYNLDHGGVVVTHSPLRAGIQTLNLMCERCSFLPMFGSLQYRTLTNCMYRFPLPIKLPVVI